MSPEEAWTEAFGRMQTAAFSTIHGRIRSQSPDGDVTTVHEAEFWHEHPDRWRIEDEHGLWYFDDGDRVLRRTDNGIEHVALTDSLGPREPQHPRNLLGNAFGASRTYGWSENFPRPLDSGTPVTVAGRRATEYQLGASPGRRVDKPYPLRITADDDSGLPLRVTVPEARWAIEIVDLDLDGPLPSGIFTWPGLHSHSQRTSSPRGRTAVGRRNHAPGASLVADRGHVQLQ